MKVAFHLDEYCCYRKKCSSVQFVPKILLSTWNWALATVLRVTCSAKPVYEGKFEFQSINVKLRVNLNKLVNIEDRLKEVIFKIKRT